MRYFNVYDIIDKRYPFTCIIGGRGVGKTYSALAGTVERKEGFMLWRRTEEERQLASLPALNPFNQINVNEGWHVVTDPLGKKLTGFYHGILDDEGEYKPDGAPIGYMMGLSAIASVRGLGMSTGALKRIIYDEAIPESHVRELKNEGEAILNGYETLNRNRELSGADPLELIMLSNSNRVNTPFFRTLGVVHELERLIKKGSGSYYNRQKGLAIHLLGSDPGFLAAKKRTAIGALTEGTAYAEMAFDNRFSHDDFSGVCPRRLTGYHPYISFGDAYVWELKGDHSYHVSYARGSFAYRYAPANAADRMLAQSRHGIRMRTAYAEGRVTWESYELKSLFLDFFALK